MQATARGAPTSPQHRTTAGAGLHWGDTITFRVSYLLLSPWSCLRAESCGLHPCRHGITSVKWSQESWCGSPGTDRCLLLGSQPPFFLKYVEDQNMTWNSLKMPLSGSFKLYTVRKSGGEVLLYNKGVQDSNVTKKKSL